MTWRIEFSQTAAKQLSKLGKTEAARITTFLRLRIAGLENPRISGKALTGPLGGLWRYRLGDYRLICEIRDNSLCVLVLKIGHRGSVYR